MKRYAPTTRTRYEICGSSSEVPYMREEATGSYVALADAQALERKVDELEHEKYQLQQQLRFAVLLINRNRSTATAPRSPC